MKRLVALALSLAVLGGCELGFDFDDASEQPRIGVLVMDAREELSSGQEALFEVHYCAESGGESYLVSELRADLEAQGANWHSGSDLRYELTLDANRDHRFGPGDILTVSEKDRSAFDGDDAGMTYGVSLYRIPEMGFDELLGKADWEAR